MDFANASIAKKPINFIEQYSDHNDRSLIKLQITEKVLREGYPVIHCWKPENLLVEDPQYNDSHTLHLDLYNHRETYALIDYQHFVIATRSEGNVLQKNTTLPAMMPMEEDDDLNPDKDEFIIFKREFEGTNGYIFRITDCNNWKGVCWQVNLVVATFDNISTGGIQTRA